MLETISLLLVRAVLCMSEYVPRIDATGGIAACPRQYECVCICLCAFVFTRVIKVERSIGRERRISPSDKALVRKKVAFEKGRLVRLFVIETWCVLFGPNHVLRDCTLVQSA